MTRIRFAGLCLVAVLTMSATARAGTTINEPFKSTNKSKKGTIRVVGSGGGSSRPPGSTSPNARGGCSICGGGDPLKGLNVSTDKGIAKQGSPNTLQGRDTLEGVVASYELGAVKHEGVECNSAGASAGNVILKPLTEELGWINKAKQEVGFEQRAKDGGLLARFTCAKNVIELRGAVIGALTPLNTKVAGPGEAFLDTITSNEETGRQAITGFEGGPTAVLEVQFNGGGFSEAVLTNADATELFPSRGVEVRTQGESPEFAAEKAFQAKETQLSLGDSLAFGYSQELFNQNFPTESPTAFENGYSDQYFDLKLPTINGIQETNKGCPGETTDSMIGNGPAGAALDPTEGESPCGYHKLGFPLHSEYGGTKSQLESALEAIAIDSFTGKPVTHLTLNIGANDELHAIAKCEAEVKAEYEAEGKSKYGTTPEKAVKGCIEARVEALFAHILKNIGSMLFAIRHGSFFGGVDYAGPIAVLGGYDPYGSVFKLGEEILPGSNALASILNFHEKKLVTDSGTEAAEEGHEPFGGCYYNPQPLFNPGTKAEPTRLQKWTNMANFTESNGKKDGPDIHPTLSGYVVLGNGLFKGDTTSKETGCP